VTVFATIIGSDRRLMPYISHRTTPVVKATNVARTGPPPISIAGS
jgi:hypothetical protein